MTTDKDDRSMPEASTTEPAAAEPVGDRLYSVPRRFDLATLFVVSLAYALLFGLMRALHFPTIVFLVSALYVTFVGLAQAVLFRGKKPREASIIASGVYWVVAMWIGFANSGPNGFNLLGAFVISLCWATVGSAFGYLFGVVIAGIFLLADVVRRRWLR